jgi:hypothetical protein
LKNQASKNRSERQFQVGEWVFLKLQPYIQSSLAPRATKTLSFKYFGPFEVIPHVGQVACKLKLPESSHLHPMFHVSLLKKVVGQDVSVSPSMPLVLKHRVTDKGVCSIPQVLIKWSASQYLLQHGRIWNR